MMAELLSPAPGSWKNGCLENSVNMRLQSEHVDDDNFKAHSDSRCRTSWISLSESVKFRRSISVQHGQSDIVSSDYRE